MTTYIKALNIESNENVSLKKVALLENITGQHEPSREEAIIKRNCLGRQRRDIYKQC